MEQPDTEILKRTYGHAKLTIEQMYSTKEEAVAGHLYYFTGKPCKHGHTAPRKIEGKSCYCYVCKKKIHDKWYAKVKKSSRIPNTAEQKREQQRAYYQANLKKRAAYRLANKEKIKALKQRYWGKNKEELKQKQKIYKETNKDTISETAKSYYQKNREIILARMKKSRLENHEKLLTRERENRQKNKDKIKQQNREYYLRKKKEREEFSQIKI